MCRWLESLIFTCRVLDTLCVVISFHIVYYYVITSYSNPSNLLMGVWSFKAHQVAGAVSISLVQTLYAIRIWTRTFFPTESAREGFTLSYQRTRQWIKQRAWPDILSPLWLLCLSALALIRDLLRYYYCPLSLSYGCVPYRSCYNR